MYTLNDNVMSWILKNEQYQNKTVLVLLPNLQRKKTIFYHSMPIIVNTSLFLSFNCLIDCFLNSNKQNT